MSNRSLCCKRFILPKSPEAINRIKTSDIADIEIIKDMLIYLGKYKFDAKGKETKTFKYHYTCKHLVDDRCLIYENRPNLCRNYPRTECDYGRECETYDICNGTKKELL